MTLNEIKVLIVDDSEDNRLILEELTKSLGFESVLANNGKEAQALLEADSFTVILLDINMPEMNGIELLKWIKGQPKLQEIPVLMVSAIEETEEIVNCLKLGADDFIHKPFEVEILKARLNSALSKFRAKLSEKELLEKTFIGSVKLLSNVLTAVSPRLFGKAARIQRIARHLCEALEYGDIWEIEIASLFSLVGTITLPPDTLEKIINGRPLAGDESTNFQSHPIMGHKLLSSIPRLEKIAEIILYQNWNLDGTAGSMKIPREKIPFGSRILRAAIEFEHIQNKSNNPMEFAQTLKTRTGNFEPILISAMEKTMYTEYSKDVKQVKVDEVRVGMVFAEDVFTTGDAKIIGQWQEVSQGFLERIRMIHAKVGVKEPILIYKPNW
ncbi:response regulator [Leptospira sp. 'Mane']|uniref:response regulator n=1 Tax=Leptospira sp. 'Mane' TaxID=3387407 RepID=UPI00398AF75A